MKPVLVVNLAATYSSGRHPERCTRSSWRVAAARAPLIDTVVGVYRGRVVTVIRGCTLVPSTPEIVGEDWDAGCRGRYYVLGGDLFTERDVAKPLAALCSQLGAPLASVQGIRYLSREQFDSLPLGEVVLR